MGAYTVTGQRARQMRVVPAEVLKRLYTRSDRHGLVQTAAHLALLVAGGWLVLATKDTWWVVPALLVQGLFVNSLFGAMHESVHYGSFKTRWMADVLAFFSGAAILNNAGFYRHYHMAHHRYTQDPARDPELYFAKPASLGVWLFVLTGIPNLHRRLVDLLRLVAGRADRPWMAPAERRPLIREARAYFAVCFAVAVVAIGTRSTMPLVLWLLPLLVGQAFLRPYLLAEHTGCASTRDCLENTRTTLTLPVVRLFAWNMPYHAEHHSYPGFPFHALTRLHRHVRERIANLEPGYVAATITVNRALFATSGRARSVA